MRSLVSARSQFPEGSCDPDAPLGALPALPQAGGRSDPRELLHRWVFDETTHGAAVEIESHAIVEARSDDTQLRSHALRVQRGELSCGSVARL